ncbi:MAG: S8 family serine peptidase [Candidatus Thiodiazotropha lotti]|nr:S8 family serine peptidase [Candidatus Thiodiazotropha lotti]
MAKIKLSEKLSKILLTLLVSGIIAACGGGGGGGSDDDDGGDSGDGGSTSGSISGLISVPGYVVTDSDVNDDQTTPVANQPANNAQSVPNPVNIGGYVNVAGTGAAGNLRNSGDPDDYYLVNLTSGQTLVLNIGDIDVGGVDLDLYLFDVNDLSNPVASSIGTSKFETIVVPSDGQYYVIVHAYSGASNYLLSIGLTASSLVPQGGMSVNDDFVPGEVLVKFDTDSSQAKSLNTGLSHYSFSGSPENEIGVQRLTLNDQFVSNAAARPGIYAQMDSEAQLKLDTIMAIKELNQRSDVVYAQPNYIYQASAIPNDEYYNLQWHYNQINLPQAWDITTGDTSVIVSVIDTGVLLNHPDLSGQLVNGYDFISDAGNANDGDGIDANPDDAGDEIQNGVSSFHGTHVAGTVAASSNNSTGVAGVAWNVRIMPIRVLGKQGGFSSDIIDGILFSAGLSNASGTTPAQRADVINMSLGGASPDQASFDAITAARNAGVIVIAAAGNENTSQLAYPASYTGVVSVSSVDQSRTRAPYSNYGTEIDVAAPGGNTQADVDGDGRADGVLSTLGDDSQGGTSFTYNFYQGTSMAAPHVAGVAALMKSVYAGLTPAEFDSMLSSGELTNDIGNSGRDDLYGHGLIDAYKAVVAAQQRGGGNTPTDPSLSVNPQSLNFSNSLQSTSLFVEEIGGSVGTVQISENISWLSVAANQVNGSGIGSYTVSVDRSGLSPATYTGTIQVSAGTSSVDVNVIMQVLDSSISGDAGRHYVLLVDNATSQPVQQDEVNTNSGSGSYSFSNVSSGDYYVVAGSDMDMDNLICDNGESCGAYPTLSQPNVITVGSGAVNGLDFSATYEYQTPTSNALSAEESVQELMVYPRQD